MSNTDKMQNSPEFMARVEKEYDEIFGGKILLSFCGFCGVMLPPNDQVEGVRCDNCDSDLSARADRVVGVFSKEGGERLISTVFGEYMVSES